MCVTLLSSSWRSVLTSPSRAVAHIASPNGVESICIAQAEYCRRFIASQIKDVHIQSRSPYVGRYRDFGARPPGSGCSSYLLALAEMRTLGTLRQMGRLPLDSSRERLRQIFYAVG